MAANPKLFPCDMSHEAQRLIAEVHWPPPCDAVTASSSCGLLSVMALMQFPIAKHSHALIALTHIPCSCAAAVRASTGIVRQLAVRACVRRELDNWRRKP